MKCSNLMRVDKDHDTPECTEAPVARWDRAPASHLLLCAAHDAAFGAEVAKNGDTAWQRGPIEAAAEAPAAEPTAAQLRAQIDAFKAKLGMK